MRGRLKTDENVRKQTKTRESDEVDPTDDEFDEVGPAHIDVMASLAPSYHGGDAGGDPPERSNRLLPHQCEAEEASQRADLATQQAELAKLQSELANERAARVELVLDKFMSHYNQQQTQAGGFFFSPPPLPTTLVPEIVSTLLGSKDFMMILELILLRLLNKRLKELQAQAQVQVLKIWILCHPLAVLMKLILLMELVLLTLKLALLALKLALLVLKLVLANLSDDTVYAFLANDEVPTNMALMDFSDSEQLDSILKRDISYKDSELSMLKIELEKIKQEKESNQLKIENFDNASKSLDKLIGNQITDKSIKGVGFVSYNVVPPPPKFDLSNSGLEEFQQPEFEGYGPKTSKSVSKDVSHELRESPDAPLVKEFVSDDKLDKKIGHKVLGEIKEKKEKLWNNQKFQQLGSDFVMYNKACFVCGSFDHVQADCNYHQRERVVSGNNYTRVNYNYSTKKAHPSAHRNMVQRAVLIKTDLRSLNTARPVTTAHPKTTVYSAIPMSRFSKSAQSTKDDGIFISQDKYVDEILKKLGFSTVKTASTTMETLKPLMKDKNVEDVDVHLYRSMIGSLMYLTSSRPDIMFVVCACARFQLTPKVSHLHAVKRIFRYLKGQPKLGLWYPKDSPFDLEAYTDSDYAGASLDRKYTTGERELVRIKIDDGNAFWNEIGVNAGDSVNAARHTLTTASFWATAKAKTVNGEVQIQALVDGKKVIVTETSVRRALQLKDAEGTECLPNATIFAELERMGAKTTAWNEFSSTMASTVILFLDKQVEGMTKHKEIYVTPSHTKKVFANIKRGGKGFSERKKQPRRKQRKDTEVPQPSGSTKPITDEAANAEHVPTHSNDPLFSGEDRLQLKELLELCTKLSESVLDLENTKTSQAAEITKLKERIKKLERRNKVTLVDEAQGRNDDNLMFDTGVFDEHEVEVEKVVSTAEVTTVSATTTTVDELTLTQTLIEIKAAKPKAITTVVTRPKAIGVVVQEPSEFRTTTSSSQTSQLPQAKDKGKTKMIEPEKPLKNKDQILINEEIAQKLQAQLNAESEEEQKLAKQREDDANIAEWDNVQAMIDADYELAARLHA
ncbi:hypothetical protein Tco_0874597 [Tanacetum coccineum]|uniref:Reverse transcriptase Ty1/copia-type domain-containing protein n=1 Tax=Tanacetum coccineum TaxID=301880 RepID=A0ABQ5BM22_9ASTR